MFEQSVLEISAETRKRKQWTALASYAMEATAIAMLLSVPLLRTEALPSLDLRIQPPHPRYVPTAMPIVGGPTQPHPASASQRPVINPYLAPTSIGRTIDMRPDPTPPLLGSSDACMGCTPIPFGDPNGVRDAVMDTMLKPLPANAVHHAAAPVPRESKAQESLLVRRVQPVYPRIAIDARIQGTVLLQAKISRDGRIEDLEVVSGPPMLVKAAAEAVMQWRYRPYLLNGEPVEVQTQVTVHFTLGGN